jgi:hypothetical protein
MSPGLNNVLESCVSRFSTICAKNQQLKLKIDEVTVIRVEQITIPSGSPLYSCTVCVHAAVCLPLEVHRCRSKFRSTRSTCTSVRGHVRPRGRSTTGVALHSHSWRYSCNDLAYGSRYPLIYLLLYYCCVHTYFPDESIV